MAYLNVSRAANIGLSERLAHIVKSLRESMTRRRVYKETVRELSALSSRDLADLGIHRAMITRIALEAAYGK